MKSKTSPPLCKVTRPSNNNSQQHVFVTTTACTRPGHEDEEPFGNRKTLRAPVLQRWRRGQGWVRSTPIRATVWVAMDPRTMEDRWAGHTYYYYTLSKNIKTQRHNIYSSSVQPLLLLVSGIFFRKRDYTGDITFYDIVICNKKHYFITIISSHGFEWPRATRYYCTTNAIES